MSVVVMDVDELERRIEGAVRRALLGRERDEPAEWLDAEAVADMLHVNARTVRKWASDGDLPVHRFGKLARFRRAEVLAWIEERGRLGRR